VVNTSRMKFRQPIKKLKKEKDPIYKTCQKGLRQRGANVLDR
jgi:hypothetical protein